MWWIIGIIISAALLIILLVAYLLTNVVLHPRTMTVEAVAQQAYDNKRCTAQEVEALSPEAVTFTSRYGYTLRGYVYNNEKTLLPENKDRVCILCHGYSCAQLSMLGYGKILMDLGFTLVMYDHRNHGESDRNFTSMGFYEKYDLKTVMDWCVATYGQSARIMTYGESMGSAIVLGHLGIDNRVFLTVADCGYNDLKELVNYLLRHWYHLPRSPFRQVADLLLKLRGGFHISDVHPQYGAEHAKSPILFIHGGNDTFVPTFMSQKMYDSRKGPKQLLIVPGAPHANSLETQPEQYKRTVTAFVRKYYDGVDTDGTEV